MTKIICFIESLSPGGAQHQLLILCRLLFEKGFDVTLVTYADVPDHFSVPAGVKRKKIKVCNLKNKYLNALIKSIYIFYYIVRAKADCFISYRQRCNARMLIPICFRSRNIKVICSERNTTIRPTFYEKLLFSILYHRSDYIVANSRTQAEYIKLKQPNLKSKVKVIHNYTDLHNFTVSALPIDTSIIKIAVFGRYDEQKNPIRFADAILAIKNKTNKAFEVHWYGGKAGGTIYQELEKKIEKLEVNDCFICHDAVKDPSLLMANFHAICLPSLYEGFSNSVAEGICSGRPMLVSDVSDNSVMVHNGENGFLFNPTNTDSICKAFLDFFNLSYDEMMLMSRASRKIAEVLFDKEAFINNYIELINS